MDIFLAGRAEGFARAVIVGLVNAAIPSLICTAVGYALMHLKRWSAATRYCSWWVLLGLVVLLPVAVPRRRPAVEWHAARQIAAHPAAAKFVMPVMPVFESDAPAVSHGTERVNITLLVFLTLCGAAVVQLGRVFCGIVANARLKRAAAPVADPLIRRLLSECMQGVAGGRSVSLALSGQITTPLVLGYLRPCIVLPEFLVDRLEPAEMKQILSHELAHLARWDDWAIGVQRIIQAVLVFHPLIQFISRQMDLNREIACDDRVIASSQPAAYAACLTKIFELLQFGQASALSVPLLARRSHLATRIETMLDRTRAHAPSLSLRQLALFAALAGCGVLVTLHSPALMAIPGPQTSHEAAPASAGEIEFIAVTGTDGSTSTFEENGNQRRDHAPFPPNSIVFREDGQSYVIHDRSTLDAAKAILRPQEELARQQEALGAQQEKLGEAQAKLGEQQSATVNRHLDAAVIKHIEKQLNDLERKIQSMKGDKNIETAAEAQARIAELQASLGEMQAGMGQEQGRLGEQQGKLGEQQGKLGDQQALLGGQQGRLGEQQAQEAKRATQKLKELIRRAQQKKLAQPLP